MTTLRERLDEYLELRRSLGFQLNDLERQLQVLVESFTQCRHRGTCPNGTTSSRSDARSTFA